VIHQGTSGNDSLDYNLSDDSVALVGLAGNDTLIGSDGNDILVGGQGDDVLTGGDGVDVFKWNSGDQIGSTDTGDHITDFAMGAGGDVLNLADLLQGEDGMDALGLSNYLHFTSNGTDTTIEVTTGGAGAVVDQYIVMEGVGDLTVNGTVSDQAIIQSMLTNNKLITD
jgi:Ca2+-binding RTX toxin-like protein